MSQSSLVLVSITYYCIFYIIYNSIKYILYFFKCSVIFVFLLFFICLQYIVFIISISVILLVILVYQDKLQENEK